MRRKVRITVTAAMLVLAATSAFLLLGRKTQYAESERGLETARIRMDACGITEEKTLAEKDLPEDDGGEELPGPGAAGLPEDFFGRIVISKVGMDLPVMKPPKEDPAKYLSRDFLGRDSAYGSIYADPSTDLSTDGLVLYGHHMKNGAMFGNLGELEAGDPVTLLTPGEARRYLVIRKYTVTPEEAEAVRELSAPSKKKRLALVTCEYGRPDERLVVLCEEP